MREEPQEDLSEDLLPCPFCGTDAEIIHRGTNNPMDNNWTVGCQSSDCFIGVDGVDWYLPKAVAVKWWNTRKEPQEQIDEELCEYLAELYQTLLKQQVENDLPIMTEKDLWDLYE